MKRSSALSAQAFNFLVVVKAVSSFFPLDESGRKYSNIWLRISSGISVIGCLPPPGGDRTAMLFICDCCSPVMVGHELVGFCDGRVRY